MTTRNPVPSDADALDADSPAPRPQFGRRNSEIHAINDEGQQETSSWWTELRRWARSGSDRGSGNGIGGGGDGGGGDCGGDGGGGDGGGD